MKEKNANTEITETDDQKTFLIFLNNLKKEEQDLKEINNFFDLAKIWETSSPFTDFRSKIDEKMFELLPAILDDLPSQLELFFIEIGGIINVITPDSENEKLILKKIESSVQSAEEKDLMILIIYYGKWSSFNKGQEIIFNKIKIIFELKSDEDLIKFRSKNEWSKPVIRLIDKILSDNLPKILPRITSVSLLFSFLENFYYESELKRLIEERLVEIFKNKFMFSIFSFEKLYAYRKLFSNKSEGQHILGDVIFVDIENMKSLAILFEKMNIVDKIDLPVRKIFYRKISDLVLRLKKNSPDYAVFLQIISEDIEKRNLPEELIPVFKKKTEEFLLS
ncbi:MAG TPA: hypothetical protein PK142_01775 [bacterium]|nr:hypothetical protein [bacterium]